MSPALLDIGPQPHTLQMLPERHPLRNPNPSPNGQFSSPFSSYISGFYSNDISQAMNSSNVGDGASGFPNSIENKSDFSFNSPPISRSGLEKAALGTAPASGLSRLPRLVKPRRQMGSHHPRSAAVPETRVNPGFNPFRPVSENSNAASSGLETSDKNEAFASAASGSNLGTNSVKWGSAGILDKEVVDDMRKLKIGSEKGIVDAGYGVSANLNEPEGSFGMGRKVSSTLDESGASELPDGMRKLNIGGSGNSERGEKSKDGNIYLSTNDKTRFGFGSGDNVGSSVGKSVESELPKEFMKLNVKDAAVLDDGSLISNADDRKEFVSGSSKKGSDYFTGSSASMLPDQMKNLNLKDSVNTQNVDKNEVNSMASEKTSFVFGSSRSTATDSLGERTETVLSNKMGNMKIGSGTGDSSGRTDTGFSSPQIFVKEMQTQDLGDKMFYDVGKSIPMEFTFQTGMPGKDASDSQVPIERPNDDFKLNGTTASSSAFSSTGIHFGGKVFEVPSMDRPEKKDEFSFTSKRDGRGTTHVDFKTPNRKENLLSGLNHKVEFSAKREAVKDTRSKKRRGKFRKPDLVQVWFGHDFVPKESSSQENPVSPVSYSPMDVSPYQETLADNQCSRETSVTSNDSFHLDINYASTDSHPTVSYDATDEDLVSATRHLDISEGDEKCDEMKEETSEYHFNKGDGAEGHPEESVSGAETESFKSATEEVDANDDVTVTSAVTEAGLNIEKQESDGRMHFFSASSSEDINGTNFTFAASSSPQGQASATARHHRMKARTKVGPDSYNHTPNAKVPYASHSPQFFPFSRTASFSSPGQSKKGDLPTSQHKLGNNYVVTKEQEIKQESISTSAAAVAAQEACEKWRIRGNQAYANGDLSKAEDYYTRGVNCVPQSETSRSCLRALTLCYSNRAATRISLGRMREALEDCLLAAAVDPSFLKVQVRAANCYVALGEIEEASRYFKKCLQSGSDVCVDRKILVEASEGLQKAHKVSKCMNQSAELLGHRTSNDAESALIVIAEALSISPHSEKLLEMKAEALFMLRKYEDVIQHCERSLGSALKNSPSLGDDGQLANLDGSVLSRGFSFRVWRCRLIFNSYFYLGKLEEALDLLEQEELRNGNTILESSIPLAVTVRELLRHKAAGNEAFQSGRHAEAVEHYTAALSCTIESRPFAAICFCNRAAAYKALGQIIDAIADCSLAIALDGNYLKAISRRASLFEMIRDYGQAAGDLQRLVSLLTKQVEEKTNLYGASDRSNSRVNDLRQAQLRLSEIEEAARKEIPLDLYLILGVEPSVTASEIKKAYRKAALRHHPDKAGQSLARSDNADDGLWKKIEEVHKDADKLFKMIGEAYAVLSDPSKRSRYDIEEETRNAQKKGNGSSASRTHVDVQNYPFERSNSRRQWREVWRSYGHSQSRESEASRSNRFS